MVKAVIFDYFGVISSDEYWDYIDDEMASDFTTLADQVNLGQLHWREFMQQFADRTGHSFAEVKSMFGAQRINPQLLAYVSELGQKYKTGLLTNAHHGFIEPIIKSAHMDSLFDSIVISSRVGIIKPDRRIYEIMLDQLDVAPDEAVFIDDFQVNVDTAIKLGINGILYKDLESLRDELVKLL